MTAGAGVRRIVLAIIGVALALYVAWDRIEAHRLSNAIAAIAARGEPVRYDEGLPAPKTAEQREAASLYAQAAGLAYERDIDMDYSKLGGLIPAVAQDAASGEVLMVGFMNEAAFVKTQDTGFATFFSRSRSELWTKGETSGNKLQVVELLVDCDDDTVLMKVKRLGDGNVCHTGARTCFRKL